jgi:hypothetical protein
MESNCPQQRGDSGAGSSKTVKSGQGQARQHPLDQLVVEEDDDDSTVTDPNNENTVAEVAEDLSADKQDETMKSRIKLILNQKRTIQGLRAEAASLQQQVNTLQSSLAQSTERERASLENLKSLQRSLARARDEIRSFGFRLSHCTCMHRLHLTIKAARGLPAKEVCVCARVDDEDRFGRTANVLGPKCSWSGDASTRSKMTCDIRGSASKYLVLEIWAIGGGSGVINMSKVRLETLPGEENAGESWIPMGPPPEAGGQNNNGGNRASVGAGQHDSVGSCMHDSMCNGEGSLLQSVSYGQTVCKDDGPGLLVSIWREPILFTGSPDRSTSSDHRALSPRAERIVRELQKRIDALTYTLQQSRDKNAEPPTECQIYPKSGAYDVRRLPITFVAAGAQPRATGLGTATVYYTLDGSTPSRDNHAGSGPEPLTIVLETSSCVQACLHTDDGCGPVRQEEYTLRSGEERPISASQNSPNASNPGLCRLPDTASPPKSSNASSVHSSSSSKKPSARAGVGILLSKSADNGGVIRVRSVEPSGPAARDGRTKAGDLLVAVDGVSVEGKDLDAVMKMVIGEEGTSVFLLMERPTEYGSPPPKPKGKGIGPEQDGQRRVSACSFCFSFPFVALLFPL